MLIVSILWSLEQLFLISQLVEVPVVATSSLRHCRTVFHSLQRFWVLFFFKSILENNHIKSSKALLKQAASKQALSVRTEIKTLAKRCLALQPQEGFLKGTSTDAVRYVAQYGINWRTPLDLMYSWTSSGYGHVDKPWALWPLLFLHTKLIP